jgi:hypothetical protein
MFTGITSVLIILTLSIVGTLSKLSVLKGFALEFSWFSLALAVFSAAVNIGFSFFSIKALGVANLSLFSIFAMLGGMLLPSIYGLTFSNEPLTWGKIACYVLIVTALFLTFEKGEQKKKSLVYCFGVFVLNGMSGVITSIHQEEMFTDVAVSSGSYMIMSRSISALVCFVLFLLIFKKMPKLKRCDIGNIAGNAACGGIGNLLQLMALVTLASSVLFPIVTGGTMLFSMLVSILVKEKQNAKTVIASIIAAASTVFMMF